MILNLIKKILYNNYFNIDIKIKIYILDYIIKIKNYFIYIRFINKYII